MLNVVPEIVLEAYELGHNRREFEAYSIFADISGFTKITEELSKSGKEGAEILTDTLNALFSPVINIIYENGGFIATFAGDALTAIFPEGTREKINEITQKIIKEFSKRKIVKTPSGNFSFSVKLGVGSGNITLRIIDGAKRAGFYFYGDAIKNAVLNEEKGKLLEGISEKVGELKRSILKTSPSTQFIFYPPEIVEGTVENAFRSVVSVFINIKETDIENVVKSILDTSYNAYLNKVDFGDKGFVAVVIFGAPIATKNDADEAVQFARELILNFPESVKAGMSFSTVYAGIVGNNIRSEYTVIGKGVNLAARLMQKANYGSILTDRGIKDLLPHLTFEYAGKTKLKGFSEDIEVFTPTKKGYYFVISEGEKATGREKERRIIREKIKEFAKGEQNFRNLLITGEEGSGKTTLSMYTVSYARKVMPDLKYAYWDFLARRDTPVIEEIRNFFLHSLGLSDTKNREEIRKKLSEIPKKEQNKVFRFKEPELVYEFLFSGLSAPEEEFTELQYRMETVITELFSYYASIFPFIAVFDNAHTLPSRIYTLILNAVSKVRGRFLAILTGPEILVTDKRGFRIHLGPVGEKDIEKLIKEITGKAPHSTLTEFILKKSGGNFKIASEMVKLLYEKGELHLSGKFLTLRSHTVDVPDNIHHLFMARFDSLPNDAKNLIRKITVLGNTFKVSILKELASQETTNLNNLLLYLTEKEVLYELTPGIYAFKDNLFQETVYLSLPLKYRKRMHLSIARTILRTEGEKDIFALFRHYYEAGKIRKAIKYGKMAMDHAMKMFAIEEALKISDKLLAILPRNSRSYAEIGLKRASALYFLGRTDEAISIYDYIISSHKGYLKAWALYKSAYLLMNKNQLKDAVDRLIQSIKVGKRNKKILANAYLNLGIIYQKRQPDLAVNYLNRAQILSEETGDQLTLAKVLLNTGIIIDLKGESEKAIQLYEEAKKIYNALKHVDGQIKVYQSIGIHYAKHGNLEDAIKFLRRAYNIAEKYSLKSILASISMNIGNIYVETGQFKNAIKFLHRAEKYSIETGNTAKLALIYNNIADTYLKKGQLHRALNHIQRAKAILKKRNNPYYSVIVAITTANIEFERNNLKKCEEHLTFARKIAKENKLNYFMPYINVLYAKLLYLKGSKEEALAILEDLRTSGRNRNMLLKIDFTEWELTKNPQLKKKLMPLLKSLSEKSPFYEYRVMLEKLSQE